MELWITFSFHPNTNFTLTLTIITVQTIGKQHFKSMCNTYIMVMFSDFRYLLSFHNVAPDYKTDFEAFLQKNGVNVEEGLDDQPHLELGPT